MTFGPIFFMKSQWLWGVLAVPLLFWIGTVAANRRKRAFEKFAENPMLPKIAPELDWSLPKRKFRYWVAALAFLFLALARPQWGSFEETVRSTGLDILLTVDVSNSMLAEDFVPNRLKKTKHFIRTLAERIPGDRLGVVAFAGSAHLISPLTTDHDYVLETIENLGPETVSNQGTDIGAALETAARALDRGAEQMSAPDSQVPSTRVVVLISDGEDNESQIANGVKKVKEAQVRLFVVGVGTEKGGPIPVRDASGQNFGFKRDRQGQTVVTKFSSTSLEKLAKDSGGRYWQMTPGESEVDGLVDGLNSLAKGEFMEQKITLREERFQIPLALAVLLILLEITAPARRLLEKKKQAKATAVPTATASVLTILFSFLWLSGEAVAAEEPTLRAYLENQKGLRTFADDKTSEAKRHFGNAQVENPLLPEFQFNSGTVQLKEENYPGASQAFESAAQDAEKSGEYGLAAKSYFNQGVARFAAKDYEGAANSYLRALEANQRMPDMELDRDIRKNLELLRQSQSQDQKQDGKQGDQDQDQKKDSSSENKDGNNANSGNQDQKKDPKDSDSDQDQKKEQQKNYQTTGKRQFKSQKLSPEDAKRVLSELSQKEKELQKKLERMKGRPQGLERDW